MTASTAADPPFRIAAALSRLGTETAFEVLARAHQLEATGRSILNLGIGQPDFTPAAHITEAAVKALRDGQHGYTPSPGILPLREAVAADLNGRHGVPVDPDHIVVVPGGKVTMAFAILMFGEAGAEILYPNPGFPIYESLIRFSGATPVPIRLHADLGFSFRAEEVLAQITPATRLIILNSPGNPTGGMTDDAELSALADGLTARPDIAILSDEIYSRLSFDGRPHRSLLATPALRDRVILLDGWSKTYAMTGWRLGYGVWPRALVPHATRLSVNIHSCVNAAAQYAGIAALIGPQTQVAEMAAAFQHRRDIAHDRLNRLPGVVCAKPRGAFYAFPSITGTGLDARTCQTRLLEEAGVATVAGTSFGAAGEGHIRLSTAASPSVIERAIDRMHGLLATA